MSAYRDGGGDPDADDREHLAIERYGAWRSQVTGRVLAVAGVTAAGSVVLTMAAIVALAGGGPLFLLMAAGVAVAAGVMGLGAFVSGRIVALRGPAKRRELAAAHEVPLAALEATTTASDRL